MGFHRISHPKHVWLVVWKMFFFPFHIWDNLILPIDFHIFQISRFFAPWRVSDRKLTQQNRNSHIPAPSRCARTQSFPSRKKISLVAREEDDVLMFCLGGMHKKMVPSCKASHKCGQPIKTHQECRSCVWEDSETMGFPHGIVFHVVLYGYPRVGSHFTTTIGPCGSAVPPVAMV